MAKITTRFIYTYHDPSGSLQFVEKIIDFNNLEWDYENHCWDASEKIDVQCSIFEPYKFTKSKKIQNSTKFNENKISILIKKYKFVFTMERINKLFIDVYELTGDGDWDKQFQFERTFSNGVSDCSMYILTDTEIEIP